MNEVLSTRRLSWLALAAALAALALVPSGASAAICDFAIDQSNDGTDGGGILGGGRSMWSTEESTGDLEDAMLLPRRPGGLGRFDAFDGYGTAEVNNTAYDNPDPDDEGCTRSDGGRTLRYPSYEVIGDVIIRPELYVDDKRPFGRQYLTITNNTAVTALLDIGWDGDLGSDNLTNVDKTSSGNAIADARARGGVDDRWATSCEDTGDPGCKQQNRFRDPELAHNWEGKGQKPQSADVVVFADGDSDFDVTFEDVAVGAGKTIALMEVVTLARNIKDARDAADQVDGAPGFIFAGLSNQQKQRIKNW
jgi:hypothetical protein